MPATILDVARVSGISVATISKYLNGVSVKKSTQQKIEAAISELNYIPNSAAKSLVTRKSNTIGVMLPFISNLFCSEIVQVFCREVRKQGYGVLLCECSDNEVNELPSAKFLAEKNVDGILSMPKWDNPDFLDFCKLKKIPVVIVDSIVQNFPVDCIVSDNVEACFEATNKLLALGHTQIALLYGAPKAVTQERILGYYKAFNEYGLTVDQELVVECDFDFNKAYKNTTTLLKEKHPTAIFATNYDMTLGAMRAISDLGLTIGENIAIIGFDNIALTKMISPAISIVEQSTEEIGIAAAKTLIRRIKGDFTDFPTTQRIPTVLHLTSSISKDYISD